MKSPLISRLWTGLAATTALLLTFLGTSHAQTTLYDATTLPAPAQAGAVHFMQLITLPQGPGNYTLSSFTLGINFTTATTNAQGVLVYFYNGVDTSPTAADALANASFASAAGLSSTFNAPGMATNQTLTFPINGTYTLNLTGTAVGVEFFLTDGTFANYSTNVVGRFSAVPPTTGSASNFVWNDAALDGNFSGSEQTNFGQATGAYVRFALNGTAPAPAPEPGTWALLAGGGVALTVALRRRTA